MRTNKLAMILASASLFVLAACSDDTTTANSAAQPDACDAGEQRNPITGDCVPDREVRPTNNTPSIDMSRAPTPETDLGESPEADMAAPIDAPNSGCAPGAFLGCVDDGAAYICNNIGTQFEEAACAAGERCLPSEGCTDKMCVPGTQACEGAEQVKLCNADGTGFDAPTMCPEGRVCDRGSCVSICELGKYRSSYVGCEYWTLDLDQHHETGAFSSPADEVPHTVVISNPNDRAATVSFQSQAAGISVNISDPSVPPRSSKAFKMPRLDIAHTSISKHSIKIASTLPVTAHQFNPLGNEGVFSNDASLLLPVNTLGKEYYALNMDSRPEQCFQGVCFDPYYAYITILATEPGETHINVTPTALIAPGDGITPTSAGSTRTFSISYGEVLNLQVGEMSITGNQDLSGTHIIGSQNIAVFAGHEGAVVGETSERCCAEHLEQQLFPLKDWGKKYIAAISPGRGIKKDHWRIIAGEDNVTITTNPPQNGANNVTLNKGEFVSLFSSESFEINATGIIQVGQFLVGQEETSQKVGDPAFVLNVPAERFREDYLVLIPEGYETNHLLVVRERGAEITVDGQAVPEERWRAIGTGDYEYDHINVSPGVFSLEGAAPFAVYAYGYDAAVSYGYPGGLNLVGEQTDGSD